MKHVKDCSISCQEVFRDIGKSYYKMHGMSLKNKTKISVLENLGVIII